VVWLSATPVAAGVAAVATGASRYISCRILGLGLGWVAQQLNDCPRNWPSGLLRLAGAGLSLLVRFVGWPGRGVGRWWGG
jgi:hypothetical protein